AHIAGQKAQPLTSFHGRSRQDDAIDLLALEQCDRIRNCEPSLPGAGRTDAEYERIAAQGSDISVLTGGTRSDWALAQVDFLEARAHRRRLEIEQRTLRDGEPDRTFDISGREIMTALELVIKPFEHVARLLSSVPRASDGDVIAALFRHHAKATLDQR